MVAKRAKNVFVAAFGYRNRNQNPDSILFAMHTPHSPRLLWMVPGISAMLASVCLAADTDSDGLDDAVETNTGVFVSASNTGTNPNAADTDGDGVPDGLEVRERTNPVDATKFNGFSKGLVAYLPLDVTISEQSGSQLRCTNHGTTAVPDRFGVQNNARDFDGLGNNIEITGSAPLQIPRDITISFWVFSRDDDALILAKGNGECAYSVGFSGLTKGIAFMRQNIEYVAVTDNPLRASEWVHITCTQDAA